MFVELICKMEGRPITVNIKNIKTYRPDGNTNNTLIEFALHEYIVAKESYEVVKAMVEREVAAERGL